MFWFEISGFCDDNQYRFLIGPSSSYPVVALHPGEPATLEQQNWPIHESQPFADDQDYQWTNSEPWFWAWVGDELIITPTLPYGHQEGELSSSALARPSNATTSRRHGQLSCSHAFRAKSPVSP